MAFTPAAGRVFAAKTTSTKGSGEIKEEKGFLDWFLGGLAKEESLLEVDPILKKVEEKNNGGGKKNSVAVPPKKNGGFGGLFAKKWESRSLFRSVSPLLLLRHFAFLSF